MTGMLSMKAAQNGMIHNGSVPVTDLIVALIQISRSKEDSVTCLDLLWPSKIPRCYSLSETVLTGSYPRIAAPPTSCHSERSEESHPYSQAKAEGE